MLLAAVFFYHGSQKAFGLFDGSGWSKTIVEWSGEGGMGFPVWVPVLVMIVELACSLGMFLGLLTRFAALGIAAVMAGALLFVHGPQGIPSSEYPFAIMIIALALLFLGGGRLSLDAAISSQLIPSWI